MAKSHAEIIGAPRSWSPGRMRPKAAAFSQLARVADILPKEGTATAAVRQSRLDDWQRRLHDAVADEREDRMPASRDDQLFYALGHSIRSLDLPVSLFDDLLSAFGQDTTTTRYDSWADVLDYCRRSANPIGRLVLRIAGHRRDDLDRSSDALCTALQLTNFWQDFGRDWRAGRLYVPREVQAACGAFETDLAGERLPAAWLRTIDACIEMTATLFERGRGVCDGVG